MQQNKTGEEFWEFRVLEAMEDQQALLMRETIKWIDIIVHSLLNSN